MKSIPLENIQSRPDIIRLKRLFGTMYGMMVGLSFAASTWGIDGYLLSRANAFYPWLNFVIGAMICMIAGGTAGWLVGWLENGFLSLPIYLGTSIIFSWLTLALPFQIFPKAVMLLDPEVGRLLNYVVYENFISRFQIAILWIALFITLAGILQIPLTEPAAVSISFFGKIAPLIVCFIIMLICGSIVDKLNNEPLRLSLLELNNTIEFAADHQGQEVDRALARTMHMSSIRQLGDVISQPHRLVVGAYDPWLGQINVLVRFGNSWADCVVAYYQPIFCKNISSTPP
jgi:hypothetical protein